MKASELIKDLQDLIGKHGDCDVGRMDWYWNEWVDLTEVKVNSEGYDGDVFDVFFD